jgi:hypothetical protein
LGFPKSAIEKFAKDCCRFWDFSGRCPGHFIPFVHGNRHLCLTSSHIPSYLEANFWSKENIAPLLNAGKPVVEAVKLSIGYLVAPQTEFAEYHYLIYGSHYLE